MGKKKMKNNILELYLKSGEFPMEKNCKSKYHIQTKMV